MAILVALILGVAVANAAYFAPLTNSYDEEVMVLTLQGLANRPGPTLFLNESSLFWTDATSDAYWRDYFQTSKGISFESLDDTAGILNVLLPIVHGVAIYDTTTNADATRYLAVMYSANSSLLPVTPALLARFPVLSKLPVAVDTRGHYPNTDAGEQAAWQFAISSIFPHCWDKTFAYSVGRSHGAIDMGGDAGVQIGLDYPVQKNAFIFNLSPNGNKYPADAALFDAVLAGPLAPTPAIFGWAEPEEFFTAPTLSFWTYVPSASPRMPAPTVAAPAAPYTVVFQTNEGDTPKILAGLMSGQWLSPARGETFVSWGVNPTIAQRFPALLEYYAATAKPSDSFFAAASGAGYVYPSKYSPTDRQNYYEHVQQALAPVMSAPAIVDIWDYSINATQLLQYRAIVPEIECFTFQAKGNASNLCLPDGTPVMQSDHTLFYPQLNDTDRVTDLYNRIVAVASQHTAPFTIIVYGLLTRGDDAHAQAPDLAAAMAQRLPRDRFTVMSVAQACTQAKARCGKMEGN